MAILAVSEDLLKQMRDLLEGVVDTIYKDILPRSGETHVCTCVCIHTHTHTHTRTHTRTHTLHNYVSTCELAL